MLGRTDEGPWNARCGELKGWKGRDGKALAYGVLGLCIPDWTGLDCDDMPVACCIEYG